MGGGGCELDFGYGPEILSVTFARPVQMAYGQGMAGLPGAMPGYPSMYHQPQYPAYMTAPYGLNTPYLGGMHPGFTAYPQVRARPAAWGLLAAWSLGCYVVFWNSAPMPRVESCSHAKCVLNFSRFYLKINGEVC